MCYFNLNLAKFNAKGRERGAKKHTEQQIFRQKLRKISGVFSLCDFAVLTPLRLIRAGSGLEYDQIIKKSVHYLFHYKDIGNNINLIGYNILCGS
jgi:hypothetical protein